MPRTTTTTEKIFAYQDFSIVGKSSDVFASLIINKVKSFVNKTQKRFSTSSKIVCVGRRNQEKKKPSGNMSSGWIANLKVNKYGKKRAIRLS